MIRSNSSRAIGWVSGSFYLEWVFLESIGREASGSCRNRPVAAGLLLDQAAERDVGVVLEDAEPVPGERIRQPELLVLKGRQRIEVVPHDPGVGDVRRHGHQVGPEDPLVSFSTPIQEN